MKKALVIIDVQNDFINGTLPVPEAETIIEPINQLMTDFELVIATQDWHPTHHFSFFTEHQGKQPFEQIEKNNQFQTLWPPHCVQGSLGADFYSSLKKEPISLIIRKGTDLNIDSYSAFFDNYRLKQTGLDGFLKGMQVEELHFVGLAADFCVYYSIKDALELGYKVILHENCTKPIDKTAFEQKKEELLSNKNFSLG